MNRFPFQYYLTTNITLDENLAHELLSRCKTQDVKKGTLLLKEGEKLRHAFFVEKGLLKQYSIDSKGKEHILQFAPENWFMADRESEYLNHPSSYFIEAIEDTTVFLITRQLILELAKKDPQFLAFNVQLLHQHILSLQKRITLLQSATAEERYLDFIKTYPDILLRVPQTSVASYMGIAPESLSRIRKELAAKYSSAS